MTIEDRLRESLQARAQQVVPAEPEWKRITDRQPRRRAAVWPRVVAATGLAAAAVVLGFVLLRSHHSPTSVHTGGSGPTGVLPTTVVPTTIAAVAEPPVPPGFAPESATRTSLISEWVLGTAPCGTARCTAIVRTKDGGATWHTIAGPGLPGPSAAASVRFADAANGWLFDPDLWATHDGGATWHKVNLLGPVTTVEAAAGTTYALVSGASGPAQLWSASTGADSWARVGAPVFRAGSTLALRGRVGYGLGDDGAVFSFSVAGVERRGTPCAGPSALAQVTDTRVAVVCVLGAGMGSSEKRLMVSDDGGRTWSTAGTPPFGGQPMGVAAATASTYVVAAASGNSVLYRTTDGGKTWTTPYVDDTSGGAPWLDLGFTDARHGFAVSGGDHGKLLTTSDGGATWVLVHFQ